MSYLRASRPPSRGEDGGVDRLRTRVPDVLAETVATVWPGALHVELTRDPRSSGSAVDYLVLPGPGRPRLLLPAADRSAAAAVVGQDGRVLRRAAMRLLAVSHRAGVLGRLPLARVRVDGGEDSLVAALRDVLAPDAAVAVRLGSWDHARSLVVRVFGRDGGTIAFGKVGIDPAGVASVRDETDALTSVSSLDLGRVVAPRVLHRGRWHDHEVLLVSPLLAAGSRRGATVPPTGAMDELAGAAGLRVVELTGGTWWQRTRRRLPGVSDPRDREVLERLARRLDTAAAGRPLPHGLSHGDWTPWNMATEGERVLLWDWEHYGSGVPVGFDHLHWLAQRLRVSAGTGPDAEARWRDRADDVLCRHLRLDRDRADLVRAAYLLEVNLRFVMDREATSQAGARRDGWGLDLVAHESDRLAWTT